MRYTKTLMRIDKKKQPTPNTGFHCNLGLFCQQHPLQQVGPRGELAQGMTTKIWSRRVYCPHYSKPDVGTQTYLNSPQIAMPQILGLILLLQIPKLLRWAFRKSQIRKFS
jgi:hypothetical protein